MKSEHRHQLETNALAKKLDVLVTRFQPYASTIAGVVVAIVVVMFLWLYWTGSSSTRQSRAWDEFNRSVSSASPDLEQLRLAAQEHPGTKMQKMADVTWADGQVWMAARDYLYNRLAATEALSRAAGAYESVIAASDDERLVNRAQLGLARVYEMQGELDQAREAYLNVRGGYEEYAKLQAERLAEPETKETYAWLATARPPLPRAPSGPGTPGRRPEFSEGELALPTADTAVPQGTPAAGDPFDELLKGFKLDFGDADSTDPAAPDRYAPSTEPAGEQAPAATPDANSSSAETSGDAASTADASTTDSADEPATTGPPTTENPTE